MANNIIPKSLHTVRVFTEVAALIRQQAGTINMTAEEAVEDAATLLGYGKTPDTYGLKAKAAAALSK